jgi:hypothetical protein
VTVFRVRDAGAAPQTAADRAAWKRVGSPKRWRVLSNGDHISRSATPSAWDVRRSTPAMKRYDAGMAKRCAKRPPGACPPVPPTTEQPVPAARESGGGHRVRQG